jgi:hypothetical protein
MPSRDPVRARGNYVARTLSFQQGVLVQILLSVRFGLASGHLRLYAAKTAAQSSGAVAGFPVSGLRLN